MKNKEYSAGIMSQSFWFQECRQFIELLRENKTETELKMIVIEENLFGAPNEYRAKRMYGYISNRVKSVESGLLKIFLLSDIETQKLIILIATIRKDKLFFEFLYEVYREKIILGENQIGIADVDKFFIYKETQNDELLSWQDTTKKRVQSAYLTFMTEANLLRSNKKIRIITPPLIDMRLEKYLRANGETAILKALTGEV